MSNREIFFVSGEVSGHVRAAEVITAVKSLDREVRVSGMGGARVCEAGAETFVDSEDFGVVGIVEVLKKYGRLKNAFDKVVQEAGARSPSAAVLVDYPGFNMRLGPAIKKVSPRTKIIYYIAPQLWAWHESRVKTLKSFADLLLVILPFEQAFFSSRGVPAEYVGHPMVDVLTPYLKDAVARKDLLIALLPGSRESEIHRNLPRMIEAAMLAKIDIPELQWAVGAADNTIKAHVQRAAAGYPGTVIREDVYRLVTEARAAVVCSGTATLETGFLQTPLVVVYRMNPATYMLARSFVKLPSIGLVNIVLGSKVCPELIQGQMNASSISGHIERLVIDNSYHESVRKELSRVRDLLGAPGAAARAADRILNLIQKMQ